ncbi:MAG: HAD-IIA family hydrolase [Anaerolineae bacterium]|nr:HAD-IIA family hydrolase [Anaerolineae bacterium]
MSQDVPEILASLRAVVMDMDGVLWRGEEPLPGLSTFFDFLAAESIPFALATNNSTKSVAAYVQKLARFGLAVRPECIVTSAVATADYLRAQYPAGTRVHVVGGAGLYELITEAGFTPVMTDADVVVVGLDPDITYEKLRRATHQIRGGAAFIGTNGDRTFPLPDGIGPGAGSILAALEASTDRSPRIIGKPEPIMFEMALARLDVTAEQTLMIGDRLETDILGGQCAGLWTALVWTGVTTPEVLAASDIMPHTAFDDLNALREAWQAARRA